MSSNISYHFAVALVRAGKKAGNLEKIDEDLGHIVRLMAGERRVVLFLVHPLVPLGRKAEFLSAVCESEVTRRLMMILVETKSLNLAGEIHSQFSAMVAAEMGVVKAKVKTAVELGPEDVARLRKALVEVTGDKVDLETSTDPNIMAGVWMRIGDKVIDNTLKTELEMAKARLVSS